MTTAPLNYNPPAHVSFIVIPAVSGLACVTGVCVVGLLDRFIFFRRPTDTIPLSDLARYAAIAFAIGFVALLIKAVIWPWE